MKRSDIDGRIPTLAVALAEHMNADELNVLATLTNTRAPTRKAQLVEHILAFLEGDRLPPPGAWPRGGAGSTGSRRIMASCHCAVSRS
jgi:hypothetical protein